MSAASVTTSLPLAISLLHTAAAQYPGLQNAQGTTTTVAPGPSSASAVSAVSSLLSTALSNLPNVQASNTQAQQGSNLLSATSNLCEPKYNDGKKTHPYCSKSCAQAKASGNCDVREVLSVIPAQSIPGIHSAAKPVLRKRLPDKREPLRNPQELARLRDVRKQHIQMPTELLASTARLPTGR
ncbi:hypothetical protein VNI00_014266 [Paramarasmius palmivorus]|uniref:Uncharacterized protein n=1 Tax=Paramarasmius palmivorus TaxID=297713 RepID=A0AAW0BU36_9AGAR